MEAKQQESNAGTVVKISSSQITTKKDSLTQSKLSCPGELKGEFLGKVRKSLRTRTELVQIYRLRK
jgi:hypothetical protein